MGEILNCPTCGKIFAKTIRDVCNECYKEENRQYKLVYDYVRKRENRMATMKEVSEATDVSEKLIIKFIKQGRIQTAQLTNLTYPCDSCGESIRTGKICNSCKGKIREGLNQVQKEQEFEQRRNERQHTYHTRKDGNQK